MSPVRIRPIGRDIAGHPRDVERKVKHRINEKIYYNMQPKLMNSIQAIYGTKY